MHIGENLVQKVHPEQRYAVINVNNGLTSIVKLATIDKCGQVSDFSQISITPMNRSDSDEETTVTVTTVTGQDYTTTTSDRESQGITSTTLGLVLALISCIVLISMSFAILCTVTVIRHRYHPITDSNTGRVRVLNIDHSV